MTAEALQLILDLQKKVEVYERFHIDLLFLLKNEGNGKIFMPKIEDKTASWVYSEVQKLIEGKNENNL
jgi:hypothetical protein